MVGVLFHLAVQELVSQLLKTLETEEGAPQHQQRRDRPGGKRTDQQGGRDQDQLVEKRTLGDSPHHRQLPVRSNPGDLLGIQGKVITEHPSSLLGRHLGHHRDVVEDGGNVINQCEQATSSQVGSPCVLVVRSGHHRQRYRCCKSFSRSMW
ncbi:hypothetical protein D3C78_1226740 [compost metagenome]